MTEPTVTPRFNRERETAELAASILSRFHADDGHVIRNMDGRRVGWVGTRGYAEVRIDGQRFKAHRVIWLLAHGRWPTGEIDHIDGKRANNDPRNLREATASDQGGNSAKKSKSGLPKGVSKHRSRFFARIGVGYKDIHIGAFDTPEEAHAAYCAAAARLFGEFYCPGRKGGRANG